MELQEQDSKAFEEIVSILQCHPEIEKFELAKEPILSLPGLEIYPSKRKVFRDRQEIQLTTKEYEILLLLVTHKGYVLTYNQIYEKVYLKLDLLILDDFLLHTITDEREIKVLFEVMEKRSELSRCTIVCSQREPNSWASMILNDEVSANAILKRATKHYTVVIQPRN